MQGFFFLIGQERIFKQLTNNTFSLLLLLIMLTSFRSESLVKSDNLFIEVVQRLGEVKGARILGHSL